MALEELLGLALGCAAPGVGLIGSRDRWGHRPRGAVAARSQGIQDSAQGRACPPWAARLDLGAQ